MNSDDRLIDALLREHARAGSEADTAFLQRLESTIAAEKEKAPVEFHRRNRARAQWAWPLGLAASVMFACFLTWKMLPETTDGTNSRAAENMVPLQTELPQELSVGTPKDLRTLQAQVEAMANREAPQAATGPAPEGVTKPVPPSPSQYAGLAETAPFTAAPAAAGSMPTAAAPKPGNLSGDTAGGAGGAPEALFGGGKMRAEESLERDRLRLGTTLAIPREVAGFQHHPPHDRLPSPPPVDRERYGQLIDNPWRSPADEVFSTFSIDVDTASYANFRRLALTGGRIPADAIRLEEMVNYFDYAYPQPTDGLPFGVQVDSAVTPWNPETRLVRVALQGREVVRTERVPANLVFLLDVSGSMNEENKLPLVVKSFQLLLEEMNAADTISIVVYAGAEGLALPPTKCDSTGREKIAAALKNLQAGGSTNGGAGIQLAYKLAKENFKEGGINRVILATDGDFNVGVTEDGGLISMVEKNAKSNVFLTVLGFGTGNLNDGMLEAITNKGNGTYHYIDSFNESRRVFLQKMMGTLLTIAKDVKIQVEFNPAMVSEYRLLGYANRMLNKEDFNNDRVDAGDIGAGHTVTAFYEIKPGPARAKVDAPRYANPAASGPAPAPAIAAATLANDAPANAKEWLTVKLRYKEPDGDTSKLIEKPFNGEDKAFAETGDDFRFAAAVAMAASVLRETEGLGQAGLRQARDYAAAAKGSDPHGLRAEFVSLLDRLVANQDDRPRE
jgi:secreted protein with Ig-like and vWFA domain